MNNNKILLKYLKQNKDISKLIVNKILNLKPINISSINQEIYSYVKWKEILNMPIKKEYYNYIKLNNNFINWLIGFSDGEGSFIITFRKNEKDKINRIIFSFKINLHIDDKNILEIILKYFNFNNIKIYHSKYKNETESVEIRISKTEDIKNIIIPLFKDKLNTKKAHDFNIWMNMFEINNNNKLSWDEKYPLLLNLSKTLNNYNYKHNDDELNIKININWYIGFMEGEGSYSVKYDKNKKYTLISEVSQREESIKLFKEMKIYLKNLPVDENCPDIIREYIKNIKINIVEYKKTNKIKLTISSIDYFYWVYFPNILKHEWNTRKSIDMTYFMIATIILKHGLHYTKEGAKLYEYIRNNNNTKRYNINKEINIKWIMKVLSQKPIYDPNIPQYINAHKRSRETIKKNIYSYISLYMNIEI